MLSRAWSAISWNYKQKSQTSSENHFPAITILQPFLYMFRVSHLTISYAVFRFVLLTCLSDILRFQLKQEQENRRNATMMFNTTRDKLKRTEEQQQFEVQERQKVELTLRNLELEMRTVVSNMKQVHHFGIQGYIMARCF